MFTVRPFNARVDVPSLEESLTGYANARPCFGLSDDPHAEMECCPRCADPEFSPDEEAEMFDLWASRNAELAEIEFMSGEPRVA